MNDNDNQIDDDGSSRSGARREGPSDSDALGARRRRSGGSPSGGMGGGMGGSGGPGGRKRSPTFSGEEAQTFDYKDPQQLKYFISDRGKITPRRVSGLSAKQQRALTLAVKRARNIALLPYTTSK